MIVSSSSSSFGTATLVGFGLLNYHWVLSAGRLLQSAVASGTSNPQPGGPVIRTFQLLPPGVPHVWNPAVEGGTMGEKLPRILPKVATSTSLLGSFTCRKLTTWDRRLYFPSKGRRAEDFFARKIRRLRSGLNPQTWVPEASTLTSRPPKPLVYDSLKDFIPGCWKLILSRCIE